jgi:predicted pyridoxine 5'-phosphate oxidase superfamily flavin-nucleotide-binding protein
MNQDRELVLPSNETSEQPDLGSGSLFLVGSATVLLRYAGFTIVTDPNFLHQGDRVHLGYGYVQLAQLTSCTSRLNSPRV